jgi:hypothetical protein
MIEVSLSLARGRDPIVGQIVQLGTGLTDDWVSLLGAPGPSHLGTGG